MSEAHDIIAKCVEHDYNRTFHDTSVCIVADLQRAGYAIVPVQALQEIRVLAQAWADPDVGDQIIVSVDNLTSET